LSTTSTVNISSINNGEKTNQEGSADDTTLFHHDDDFAAAGVSNFAAHRTQTALFQNLANGFTIRNDISSPNQGLVTIRNDISSPNQGLVGNE
jgi:hypothetical protein